MYLYSQRLNIPRSKAFAFSLILLILWFVADRTVSFGLEKALLKSNFRISKIYKGNAQAEVLILGNSRGVNGFFAPAIESDTGLKTLNLSYNDLRIATARLLLEDYIENNSPPKTLLLEVTNLRMSGFNQNILQLYAGVSERMQKSREKKNSISAYAQKYVTQTYQYNGELFLRALYYITKSDQNWINRYEMSQAYVENYVAGERAETWTKIHPDAKEELILINSICREHGIDLKPVITPIAPIFFNEIKEYENWVAEIDELTDTPVVDLGRELEELEYFADPIHMNQKGFNAYYPILKEQVINY
jgi:hypothetical protein